MKKKLIFIIFLYFCINIACKKNEEDQSQDKIQTVNIKYLFAEISRIQQINDSDLQLNLTNQLWDSLVEKKQIPWISNDTIIFLYKNNATTIHITGDMTGWEIDADYQCKKIGNSEVWYLLKTYPKDARLDYKIVENNTTWKLDPQNPKKQLSGFGYNSAFAMPQYDSSEYVMERQEINKGTLTEAQIITSNKLNRDIRFWVYMPYGYNNLTNLPSMYAVDGQEYKTKNMGSMITILDNLIADNLIQPIIFVFVDAVNPTSNTNQRVELFLNNPYYADFFKYELVPFIDNNYKTINNPEKRAILGTSYGGNCATYFGYLIPDVFKLIAPQSPAYNSNILTLYSQTNTLFITKVFITTGVINDTENYANSFEQILKNNLIPYKYIKVNEGHSWGNWAALLDDILIYFYQK